MGEGNSLHISKKFRTTDFCLENVPLKLKNVLLLEPW